VDGSEPTESSPNGNPVFVAQTTTVKAKTFRSGWSPSNTVTATYVLEVVAPTISLASGTYDIGQTVTLSVSDPFALIRYTTDATDPTESTGVQYSTPIVLNQPTTLKVRAFRSGFSPSVVVTAVYQLRLPTPTLTPGGGAFTSPPSVTIGSSVSGVTIRCTFDGNEPTETSETCTTPQAVPLESTFSVRLYKPGWVPSSVVVDVYASANPPVVSPGTVSPAGVAATGFVSTPTSVTFSVGGAMLNGISSEIAAYRNQTLLPVTASVSSFTVGGLTEGRNDVDVYGVDTEARPFSTSATIWAGSRSAGISVFNTNSQPVSGASVTGRLSDDEAFSASGTTNSNGAVTLQNTPNDRWIHVLVNAPGYRAFEGYIAPFQSGGSVTLDHDNNDLSAGFNGWVNLAGANAYIVGHSEASRPWEDCPSCEPRTAELPPENLQPASSVPGADNDLRITTYNAWGPQTVTRRFVLAPGAGSVRVRYRFGTAEFGHPLPEPDTFRVKLRNIDTGEYVEDFKTIFQVAFDANNWTAWRQLTLTTSGEGFQIVELSLTVTNAVDIAYISAIESTIRTAGYRNREPRAPICTPGFGSAEFH
jgi:hypothetical protein